MALSKSVEQLKPLPSRKVNSSQWLKTRWRLQGNPHQRSTVFLAQGIFWPSPRERPSQNLTRKWMLRPQRRKRRRRGKGHLAPSLGPCHPKTIQGRRKESGRNVVSPDLTLTEATENLLGQLQGRAKTSKAKREICQKSKGRRLRLQN